MTMMVRSTRQEGRPPLYGDWEKVRKLRGALSHERASITFADPAKVRAIDFEGT